MTLRIFKFYDATKKDFAKAVFYGADLGRVEYISPAVSMEPLEKINFEEKLKRSREDVKDGFIDFLEKFGSKMSIVTKSGFKFYCEEITDQSILVNAVADALGDLIVYEQTDEILRSLCKNFRTQIKQLHQINMEKKEMAEKRKKEIEEQLKRTVVTKKW